MDRGNRLPFIFLARNPPRRCRRRHPAAALFAQHNRFRLTWGLHAAAGLTMMIWIFVEIAIVLAWSPLQGIFFTTGLVQTILAVLALGAWPHPFLQRVE